LTVESAREGGAGGDVVVAAEVAEVGVDGAGVDVHGLGDLAGFVSLEPKVEDLVTF
jgi:hypothetical protein